MKNYIVASVNSVGVVTNYIVDDVNKLIVTNTDLEQIKKDLELVKEIHGPSWNDYKVYELVEV